jgi:hypothetical protein
MSSIFSHCDLLFFHNMGCCEDRLVLEEAGLSVTEVGE